MTRQDYELIAATMKDSKPFGVAHSERRLAQWLLDCHAIAGAMGSTDSPFDRSRFLIACGAQASPS